MEIPYDMPPPLLDDEDLTDEGEAEEPIADEDDEDDEIILAAPVPGDEELDVLPFDDETNDTRPSRVVISEEQQDEDFMHVQQVPVEVSPLPLPKPPPAADTPPELVHLQKSWQEVINLTGAKSKTAGKDVSESSPVALLGEVVTLEFAHPFHFERVQSKDALRTFIAENICHTLDVPIGSYRVKCILKGKAAPPPAVPRSEALSTSASSPAEAANAPSSLVQQVIAVFGGNIIDDDKEG